MNPLTFELRVMARSRGAWLALALACAPAALALAVLALARSWGAGPLSLGRIWWPTAFVFATVGQAGLMPFVQLYLLGDSLAGQVSDHRLRTLLGCPVSHHGLFLGKLTAVWLFTVAVVVLSMVLHAAGGVVSTVGSNELMTVAGRGYHVAWPLFVLMFLSTQAALAAFLGLVFSLVGSFRAGLLGTSAAAAAMLGLQYGALRAPERYAALGAATVTSHYIHGLGIELLMATSLGKFRLEAEHWTLLAWLLADVVVFGVLGCLAFRHRQL